MKEEREELERSAAKLITSFSHFIDLHKKDYDSKEFIFVILHCTIFLSLTTAPCEKDAKDFINKSIVHAYESWEIQKQKKQ